MATSCSCSVLEGHCATNVPMEILNNRIRRSQKYSNSDRLSKQAVTKGTHNFKLSFFSFLDLNICPHFQWKTICNPLYWKYLKLAGVAQGDCESQRSRYAPFLNKDARLPGLNDF